jgi:ribosomal protein S18 acetylase RimI-like enzyme
MTARVRLVPVLGLEARTTLRALHASVTGEPFTAAGLPDAVVADLVRLQFDAQQSEYATRWPDAVDHLVMLDDRPVGRCWTVDVTDPVGVLTAVHVLDVAVVPDARRQGVATTVLQSVIARADAAGVDCVLTVRSDNVAARHLYTTLGFVEVPAVATTLGQLDLRMRHPARRLVVTGR